MRLQIEELPAVFYNANSYALKLLASTWQNCHKNITYSGLYDLTRTTLVQAAKMKLVIQRLKQRQNLIQIYLKAILTI